MVAGMELALILRAKGGRAFLTQSRGLDVKAATDASWEVANTLAHHAALKGRGDAEESGDDAPGFAAGDMPASNGRFRVVYRLANQVYVMGVAPAHGNVFFASRVVNAATHHLVAVNRGISVTPDRIANRFPEVYLAFSELIANGGKLERATAGAEAAIDSLSSEAAKAVKQLKKSFTASLSIRKSQSSVTKQAQPEGVGNVGGGRTLADEVDPLTRPAFAMPEDALPPLQYVPSEKAMMAPPRAWGGFDGYRLMPLEQETAAEDEKKKDEWLGFQPQQEPPPEAPPISALEDIAFPETPTGPRGLWLEEFWRCHVVGGKPQRMGIRGRVMGNAPASTAHLHTVFRLQPPAEANRVLEAAVLAAKPNREIAIGAEELAENCYVAYFDRIFGKKDPVFTEYRLPAMAVPPPLQVYFLAFLSEPAEGDTRARVTLVLRYAAAEGMPAPLYDVTVDMDVHPHLAAPAKVSPEATWSSKQHRLRWVLPAIHPGDRGDLKAQFLPDTRADPLAAAGILEGAAAAAVHETLLRLRFVSPPRHTLTGTRIDCGVDAQTLEPTEFAEFYGELTAQPELREVP